MTEQEAQQALTMKHSSLQDICNYFIDDLTPYARVELPEFGSIGNWDSKDFFIPMRALLGDLCLWAGRYQEAARWYHDYLNDEQNPITLSPHRITWPSVSEFLRPTNGYSFTSSSEVLSVIPMENRVFDGVVSDLRNIFDSTNENNYYYQLTPSAAMRQISAAQTYCMEYKTDTHTDTIYAPTVGLQEDILVGDLRLYANYRMTSAGGQDPYSEYSSLRQTINKIVEDRVITYRRSMVYLRYAEALNRAGLPQSAFAILKYGLCPENVVNYVDSLEQEKAGQLISFDANTFTKETTFGIHSLGSGDSEANAFNASVNAQRGVLGNLYGFDFYMRSTVLRVNAAGTTLNPTAAATTSAAGIAWQEDCVSRAEGNHEIFDDTDNPLFYGDVMSALVRAGGSYIRNDKKGVAVIYQVTP